MPFGTKEFLNEPCHLVLKISCKIHSIPSSSCGENVGKGRTNGHTDI
jgi:hypothetical protein